MKKFPAGTYYVGDPCYAIPDEDWSDFCSNIFEDYGERTREFYFEFSGEQVWCAFTKHGDGAYDDQYKRKYHVDAGLIGIVPMTLVVPEPGAEAIHDPKKRAAIEVDGGHIVDFPEEFVVGESDGVINIGQLRIDTDPTIHFEDDEDEMGW